MTSDIICNFSDTCDANKIGLGPCNIKPSYYLLNNIRELNLCHIHIVDYEIAEYNRISLSKKEE